MSLPVKLDDNYLESLPGLGPAFKKKLFSIGIKRISDLILFLPAFLIDKTKLTDLNQTINGDKCLFIGVIKKIVQTKSSRRNLILTVHVGDTSVQIRFLHKIVIYSHLKIDMNVRVTGIARLKGKVIEFIHPEIEVLSGKNKMESVVPYYKTKRIISQNKIRKFIKFAFDYINIKKNVDVFSNKVLNDLNLPHYLDALKYCHFPSSDDYDKSNNLFIQAKRRFIIEEIITHKLILYDAKKSMEMLNAFPFEINCPSIDKLIHDLPFELTPSQDIAISDLKQSLIKSFPTKRLIQGDVGSGKTIIAILACYMAKISGLQAAVLVPTEILADQHYISFCNILKGLELNIVCLKGNLSNKTKTSLLNSLSDGSVDIVIGTHALIHGQTKFKKLGIIIVDEQHKFGINQRNTLNQKHQAGNYHPHEVYLSATPIPRSLSLVLYEGLDYSLIKDLPKDRRQIITRIFDSTNRKTLYNDITKLLQKGDQIYWVCPCIDVSENLELEYVRGVHESLKKIFNNTAIKMLHGRLESSDNKATMKSFMSGETSILVATSMIEVGVDIPNATCMVIENPERFGLSQLHQLRGRVGRSNKQSYCFLAKTKTLSENAFNRIKLLTQYTNGFDIAEQDLKLRGSGDYLGEKQSGVAQNFKLATSDDAIRNYDIICKSLSTINLIDNNGKRKLKRRWGLNIIEDIKL
tara:strand:+ start:883 stop:2958 length:2076 start_codon:yes stop_codon:yes gene_type:complete